MCAHHHDCAQDGACTRFDFMEELMATNGTSADTKFTETTMEHGTSINFVAISMVSVVATLSVALAVVLVRGSHATGGLQPLLGESVPQDVA